MNQIEFIHVMGMNRVITFLIYTLISLPTTINRGGMLFTQKKWQLRVEIAIFNEDVNVNQSFATARIGIAKQRS